MLKKERKEIHAKGHERKTYMPKSMRKKESNNPMPKKKNDEKEEERKIAHTFKGNHQKTESHVQRSTKIFRFRKIIKFPHTCTS
jgi:hypothetical protein